LAGEMESSKIHMGVEGKDSIMDRTSLFKDRFVTSPRALLISQISFDDFHMRVVSDRENMIVPKLTDKGSSIEAILSNLI
ncbi:MAG TPA: hypothetical protein VLA17_14180, partial [Candidatus Limnocylindria bacterium]|nr:hypothetical protein [Candidatus Limnocylindria bacterium]